MKIRWNKIIANAGTAFFTTLSGVALAGLSINQALYIAIFPAAIQAGLAFFRELQVETGNPSPKKRTRVLNAILFY